MTTAHADTASQVRSRLMSAMVECIAELGYRATTVADVVRVARVSRRSFYEHFSDKTACFIAVLREANQEIIDSVDAAVDPSAPWTEQVRSAVTAYVRANETHPGLTLSWIRELPALGDSARAVKAEGIEAWTRLFERITSTPQVAAAGIPQITRPTAIIVWGGIRELTANAMESGAPLSSIIEPATQACVALLSGTRTDSSAQQAT
ncbi:TetR/AcrR family transcriptional regulator [Gordonia humi]|uniref:AcrR family transcriptional regulator n=1 Tax=Gordonia humi TaxID=686429 RepID=A0A840F0F3_9ACTN|nr:AcrR family transcriptional regulator [Gordonia humi]